jgi:cysteinyl-tRNA synthetase
LAASCGFLGLNVGEVNLQKMLRATNTVDEAKIADLISARFAARRARDFKKSDRIRDELAAMGVQLKDSKNKETGEIETTWEVKR